MSSIPIVPIQRLIQDVTGDLHVVVAANEQGFRETALEACLLAKEKLQAIREELLRPHGPAQCNRGTGYCQATVLEQHDPTGKRPPRMPKCAHVPHNVNRDNAHSPDDDQQRRG